MMFKRLTNLFKSKGPNECAHSDCQKLIESLHMIIDEEITEDEKKEFRKHMDECKPCFDKYHVEKSLLDAIKSKIDKKCCPEKVIHTIKDQISKEQISTQS